MKINKLGIRISIFAVIMLLAVKAFAGFVFDGVEGILALARIIWAANTVEGVVCDAAQLAEAEQGNSSPGPCSINGLIGGQIRTRISGSTASTSGNPDGWQWTQRAASIVCDHSLQQSLGITKLTIPVNVAMGNAFSGKPTVQAKVQYRLYICGAKPSLTELLNTGIEGIAINIDPSFNIHNSGSTVCTSVSQWTDLVPERPGVATWTPGDSFDINAQATCVSSNGFFGWMVVAFRNVDENSNCSFGVCGLTTIVYNTEPNAQQCTCGANP